MKEKCDICGKRKESVCCRSNVYAIEIGGCKNAMHTICDECNRENIMDI